MNAPARKVIADPKAIAARRKDGQKIEQNISAADKSRKAKGEQTIEKWRKEHIKLA